MDKNLNDIDNHIDDKIYSYLNLENPKSFLLFAGAGSGKTRSLVNVLSMIRKEYSGWLRLHGKRIAVITYTNAACDEIKHRLEYDSLFLISTIHSFSWELIQSFQDDIRNWLDDNLKQEIAELQEKQTKGRSGTKASIDREKKLESKIKRLDNLKKIKRFTYNPNGDNRSRDSLNHAEVIKITAYFLSEKVLMQKLLIRKYPILLIDESQDTNKLLMDAFFKIQHSHSSQFSLGLFGDTMQRIYTDGKTNLGELIPDEWEKPAKVMNHRCPKRIITLINRIRSDADGQQQQPRSDKEEGVVRVFIVSSDIDDKIAKEQEISDTMAKITDDQDWSGANSDIKVLTLEHHMAARRMGFLELFATLYKVNQYKTGLLDGSLPSLKFFTKLVLPLIKAKQDHDEFAVASVIRNYSPLLSCKALRETKNQLKQIRYVNDTVRELYSLWEKGNVPRIIDVLQNIAKSNLFEIPEILAPIAYRSTKEQKEIENTNEQDSEDIEWLIDVWDDVLSNSFTQIEAYDEYVSDKSRFGTHQGVKGLEFPRVMVILDDEAAGGFLFSYEKLFGAKEQTRTDIKNIEEGRETSIDRTRRLFYVICSRAKKSLAIVAYTNEPEKVKQHIITQGWFNEDEVIGYF